MRARVLTALWYAPLWVGVAWLGHLFFIGFFALAALFGGVEYFLMLRARQGWVRWAALFLGTFYIVGLPAFWVALRVGEGGRERAIFGLLVVFTYDTFAFFTGRRWGRHRMAPRISPGKTYEGAAGGAAAALAAAALLSPLLGLPPTYLPLALALSAAAQLGDLFESSLKRSAGVKDSGSLLPGHGGVLDRIDSLLFAGPVLYYGVLWLT